MARFLNKNELITIVLLLLLFELNSFSFLALEHLTYKNKTAYILVTISLIVLFLDMYIYHRMIRSIPLPTVKFINDRKHGIMDCEEKINQDIEKKQEAIDELEDICAKPTKDDGQVLSERIVFGFIAFVLSMIALFSIIISGTRSGDNINSVGKTVLFSIPLFITSSIIAFLAYYIE